MADAIVHRGPDDFGYLHLDSSAGGFQLGQVEFAPRSCDLLFANRRLSIVDLSANARQPLANEDASVFVVYNGEIYNHVELRELLESKGHVFRSRSDTEVIVHAYEEWGTSCVERFNGMWAFALWDQRKRRLLCSRDRFGVKPFYYYLDADVFVFASEIKAILPALDARPRVNDAEVADYLLDGALCRTAETFFAGIQRLEPAHNLVVTATEARTSRYWDYTTQSRSYDHRDPVETFHGLLHDAVRLRLRGDVPVAIALSGGLDSTAVLAEATVERGGRAPSAFTAVFPGEPHDEHEYARIAAEHFGAELQPVEYSPDRLGSDLERVIWHHDYPPLLAQVLPRWALMREVSRHVKVVLEGQGADELLAGYIGAYFLPYLADQWQRVRSGESVSLRHVLGACLAPYRAYGAWGYTSMVREKLGSLLATAQSAYTPELLARRRPREEPPALFPDRLTQAMHADHARTKLPMLLKFGDAISMAHSLESRVPFLDYRLVEFVFALPPRHKFEGGRSKGILRQALAGAIPERIRSRRDKNGFVTPIARWMRERLDSEIRPLLLSDRALSRGIFDRQKLDRLLVPSDPLGSAWGYSVFRWLSLEVWFRLFIDGESAPAPPARARTVAAEPLVLASGTVA